MTINDRVVGKERIFTNFSIWSLSYVGKPKNYLQNESLSSKWEAVHETNSLPIVSGHLNLSTSAEKRNKFHVAMDKSYIYMVTSLMEVMFICYWRNACHLDSSFRPNMLGRCPNAAPSRLQQFATPICWKDLRDGDDLEAKMMTKNLRLM